MQEIFDVIAKAVKELGITSGFIRAAALLDKTIEEVEDLYYTLR